MTDPDRDGWDDARLGAAFAARAERAAAVQAGLADAVADAIAVPRPAARRRFRFAAAMAFTVLVLGGTAFLSWIGRASHVAQQSASPAAKGSAPGGVLLSLLSVSEAIAIRERDGDSHELAVAGFLSTSAVPMFCSDAPVDRNPAALNCAQTFDWILEQPEALWTTAGSETTGRPPSGPAFHPSFVLVGGVGGAAVPGQATPIELVGHFDDRRAVRCTVNTIETCRDTFVVDRIMRIGEADVAVATVLFNERWDELSQTNVTEQPLDLEADVDRLTLDRVLGGTILSRQLVTIDRVIGIEPILADDDIIPFIGNPATLMWFVTVLDPHGDVPLARTFALMDGSNWFAEVTAAGAVHFERQGSGPPPNPSGSPLPSADPSAFDTAPTSVLGINVRDIATVERDRRAVMDDLGRDELAIKGWYVGPDPTKPCQPALAPIHPPTPPCDEGRHWLVDRPDQLATEAGQVRTDPEHWPPVLNPVLPVDVPFEVPPTWVGAVVNPQPVIVLGHFEDNRVDAYHGNVYFVIDALAWTRDRAVGSIDSLTRLTSAATEDPAAVLARIEALSPNDAVATWVSVVDSADFARVDPRAARDVPEFTTGAPVWLVRRLIHNEMDGRQRLAVEWSYTADHGSRVWLTETPDSGADLATSLDLHDANPHYPLVRVFDYDQQVVAVRPANSLGDVTWQPAGPYARGGMEVARGATDREVAIRWSSGTCHADWRVAVRRQTDGSQSIVPATFSDECTGDALRVQLILVFDHPVDIDRVSGGDQCCG